MQGQMITLNNKQYNRNVEMLGDVEKITWFEVNGDTETEIYSEEEAIRLEEAYEDTLLAIITPVLPII